MTTTSAPTYIQPAVLTTPAAAVPVPVSRSPVIIRQAQSSMSKKRDTSGTKAIHNCDSCGKSFTTKFNLKRHINMHCHKSRENGIPIQGPPSASAPAKKPDNRIHKQFVPLNYPVGMRPPQVPIPPPNLTSMTPITPVQVHRTQCQDLTNNNNNNNTITSPSPLQPVVDTSVYQPPPISPTSPDTTCHVTRLPSVQTLLPVSTVYTLNKTSSQTSTSVVTMTSLEPCPRIVTTPTPGGTSASEHNSPSVTSPTGHNTDYGTLPADLFEPDSSDRSSSPPVPTPGPGWVEPSTTTPTTNPSSPTIMLTSVPHGWTRKIEIKMDIHVPSTLVPLGKSFPPLMR